MLVGQLNPFINGNQYGGYLFTFLNHLNMWFLHPFIWNEYVIICYNKITSEVSPGQPRPNPMLGLGLQLIKTSPSLNQIIGRSKGGCKACALRVQILSISCSSIFICWHSPGGLVPHLREILDPLCRLIQVSLGIIECFKCIFGLQSSLGITNGNRSHNKPLQLN